MDVNYKLLIVDDDAQVLNLLELAFMDSPYQVSTCNDPVKAYQRIENEHFDIVITDIQMPQMDGLTLLRKIKNFNGMIQVLIMTAHMTINNTLNAFRYGAVDIFFKPFENLDELLQATDNIALRLNRVHSILNKLVEEEGRNAK
ncbi:MAG: response regulator [Desulfobulbaceae bacterium]|nr:response regulator [Desulfobulbaceae bacterium]HIJ78000.1 response regulator [Deltaproteobacteria bacterium]